MEERSQQSRRSERLRLNSGNGKAGTTSSTKENHPPLPPLKGHKRPREVPDSATHIPTERPQKRLRSLSPGSFGEVVDQEVVSRLNVSQRSYIGHWAKEKDWPESYFQQGAMNHLLARQRSSPLRRKRSESSFTSATPSDQRLREDKAAPYASPNYATLLEIHGSFYMNEDKQGMADKSERLCQILLEEKQPVPRDTIFRDDAFDITCNKLMGKNEARIFKDLTPLLVPSAESLATLGAEHLDVVVESVNEGWNRCIPVTKPRPQPDYALGFGRPAFSDDQLLKLQPFLGEPSDQSYFMATYYMHFPFLTCEVKCGSTGLEIADRQNAHSMTVAMKGVVELFRGVGREQELHRQVLGFSYSHDDESVRIWAHYPTVDGDKTTFRRHSIRKLNITEQKGSEKWTSYTFTKNLYEKWVTPHFNWICSAIDDLPDEPNLASEKSGLSQPFANQDLVTAASSGSSQLRFQNLTPDAFAQPGEPLSKKKKGKV